MKGLTGNRGAIAQWRGAECSALERGERRCENSSFRATAAFRALATGLLAKPARRSAIRLTGMR